MAKKLNKAEVADAINGKIDWACKLLQEDKIGELKTLTMAGLQSTIDCIISRMGGFCMELENIKKESSPLTESEQLLYEAYSDINNYGFEGGGGLSDEQCIEYNKLRAKLGEK